ncbi:DUF805 domain-containing protein [Novosphingobium sp. Chol11]|uniref:DUF805 domain-containing protein n=1 Tax=Novosphingobium sp. Chol11 TaxID=1385763 RepID=UPI0025E6FFC5|nr:DUF805 domain-containing protein [Novosphingobium sp. Chol11]
MEWMFMPYRRYADFSGRSCRREYWMYSLFLLAVYVLLAAAAAAVVMGVGIFSMINMEEIMLALVHQPLLWLIVGLAGLFSLVNFIPSIAIVVRRLHDMNVSGWWYLGYALVSTVPYLQGIAFIAFLLFLCLRGTAGPNRFGPDPLDRTGAQVFA